MTILLLIYDLCKQFLTEFMFTNVSFKPSLTQQDVDFVNEGPIKSLPLRFLRFLSDPTRISVPPSHPNMIPSGGFTFGVK